MEYISIKLIIQMAILCDASEGENKFFFHVRDLDIHSMWEEDTESHKERGD